MLPDNATVSKIVRELDPDLVDWFPSPTIDHIVASIMEDGDPGKVIAESQSVDTKNAPFVSVESLTEIVTIIATIKTTWELIAFADEVTQLLLDNNKKLEFLEKVVLRLKQCGLVVPADRLQGWIDLILERMTRPSAN
jgi:hypothetical protein